MLNSQRERRAQHRSDMLFSRRLLGVHVFAGWLPALLLFLHNLVYYSWAAMIWWLASLILVPPIKSGRDFARVGLGWFCLAGAAGCLYLVTQFPAVLPLPQAAQLAHDWIPLWAGAQAVVYLLLGLMLMYNQRIKKAVARGFSRW